MEAKDLMFGDWVNIAVEEYNNPTRIREIGSFWVKVIKDEMAYGNILVTPIPLTTEILEKNGWVNQHFGTQRQEWWLDKTKFPIVRYSVNDTLHHNGIVLKFVHQLQHALKVCGIDKEIEL